METAAGGPAAWVRRHRRSLVFLALFTGWILAFALFLQFDRVTIGLVRPYTEGIARVAGGILDLFGEQTSVHGTLLQSPRYRVNIYHGCNGLLATSIYAAAVLAFPATWRQRGIGLGIGMLAIQAINMLRIVSLYYIGIYFPQLFAVAHGYVWQSIVILLSMVVWIFWAERFVQIDRA